MLCKNHFKHVASSFRALTLLSGRAPDPCRDFRKTIRPVFNAVLLETEDQEPLILTFDLIPFTEISPDNLNPLMILCSVDGGISKVVAILRFSEIVPHFLDPFIYRLGTSAHLLIFL